MWTGFVYSYIVNWFCVQLYCEVIFCWVGCGWFFDQYIGSSDTHTQTKPDCSFLSYYFRSLKNCFNFEVFPLTQPIFLCPICMVPLGSRFVIIVIHLSWVRGLVRSVIILGCPNGTWIMRICNRSNEHLYIFN